MNAVKLKGTNTTITWRTQYDAINNSKNCWYCNSSLSKKSKILKYAIFTSTSNLPFKRKRDETKLFTANTPSFIHEKCLDKFIGKNIGTDWELPETPKHIPLYNHDEWDSA